MLVDRVAETKGVNVGVGAGGWLRLCFESYWVRLEGSESVS